MAKSRLTGEQGKVRRLVIFAIILVCNQHVSTNPPQGGREQYYRMDNGLGADDDKKTLADKLQVASITKCSSQPSLDLKLQVIWGDCKTLRKLIVSHIFYLGQVDYFEGGGFSISGINVAPG